MLWSINLFEQARPGGWGGPMDFVVLALGCLHGRYLFEQGRAYGFRCAHLFELVPTLAQSNVYLAAPESLFSSRSCGVRV